jgi:hypothetical protein
MRRERRAMRAIANGALSGVRRAADLLSAV